MKDHLRLKEVRKHLKFTQVQMGDYLRKNGFKINQPNYSEMESGNRAIPLEYIRHFHNKYGLSLNWFFEGTGPMFLNKPSTKFTITDIKELTGKVDLLERKVKTMDKGLKKLYTDYYSKQ